MLDVVPLVVALAKFYNSFISLSIMVEIASDRPLFKIVGKEEK